MTSGKAERKRPSRGTREPPPKRAAPAPGALNPRLQAQTRKVLGKHYMSKYRAR
jgi:hypothetical protein